MQKSIIYAKANGINLPKPEVNLPPGAVAKAANQVGIMIDNKELVDIENKLLHHHNLSVKAKKELEKKKLAAIECKENPMPSKLQENIAPTFHRSTRKKMVAFGESTNVVQKQANVRTTRHSHKK